MGSGTRGISVNKCVCVCVRGGGWNRLRSRHLTLDKITKSERRVGGESKECTHIFFCDMTQNVLAKQEQPQSIAFGRLYIYGSVIPSKRQIN